MSELLKSHSHKIIVEVSGHDHVADVRYSTYNVTQPDNEGFLKPPHPQLQKYYHNLIIYPGLTSNSYQNPGYAVFKIDG
jgi:hypothetical protein